MESSHPVSAIFSQGLNQQPAPASLAAHLTHLTAQLYQSLLLIHYQAEHASTLHIAFITLNYPFALMSAALISSSIAQKYDAICIAFVASSGSCHGRRQLHS